MISALLRNFNSWLKVELARFVLVTIAVKLSFQDLIVNNHLTFGRNLFKIKALDC